METSEYSISARDKSEGQSHHKLEAEILGRMGWAGWEGRGDIRYISDEQNVIGASLSSL